MSVSVSVPWNLSFNESFFCTLKEVREACHNRKPAHVMKYQNPSPQYTVCYCMTTGRCRLIDIFSYTSLMRKRTTRKPQGRETVDWRLTTTANKCANKFNKHSPPCWICKRANFYLKKTSGVPWHVTMHILSKLVHLSWGYCDFSIL